MDKIIAWIMDKWQAICDFIAKAFETIATNMDV